MPSSKKLTSAVEGMTVAEVRKCLSQIRKAWADSCSDKVFDIRESNSIEIPYQDFCFRFVKGHHEKRQRKKHVPMANADAS